MALYTLGDTHLSLSVNKPMDVFGGVWQGYLDKLAEGFSIRAAGGHPGASPATSPGA